jgi:AraC-like DNA-binding protein
MKKADLQQLLKRISEFNEKAGFPVKRSDIESVARVHDLVLGDLRSHYSMKTLISIAETNACTLKKMFRIVFDISIYKFRIRERMQYAKEQLLSTDKMIMEIADECGYGNAEYFTNSFKKIVGMTPTGYRRSILSQYD